MMSKIKPALVLALITVFISALLIVAHNLTYVDTSGIITDKLREKCVQLMGEGDFSMMTEEAWSNSFSYNKPEEIERVILKDDGSVAYEVVVSGYSKNGLDLLIAMNKDGSVKGISVAGISETPGLGTKVNDSAFLDKFSGKNEAVSIVKTAPKNENEIEAVTSATYSSKGVAKAVNIAITAYSETFGKAEGGEG
ncbi:MAG: FMN-binding protein [Ruminiclostridium sp.]